MPKFCLAAGLGRRGDIVVTQPRRVAAQSVAVRLKEECGDQHNVISSAVRFADKRSDETALAVVTDGLLLAELSHDPDLLRYDAIIVDEAHERSLNIDVLLAVLQDVRRRRPELRIIIMSASIDAERFAQFMGDNKKDVEGGAENNAESDGEKTPAPLIAVGGRNFPVDVCYHPPGEDELGYLSHAIQLVKDIHESREPGGILVFLPTERDILEGRRRLAHLPAATVLPLFGRLNNHEQQAISAPCRGRRVVLATNVAETSLTVPDIRFVVDTGLARVKRYAAAARTERLPIEAISQASCQQRAGRAGRTAPGTCHRLYSEEDFGTRDPYTQPEILRSNLASVMMQCFYLRLGDAESLPWLDAPTPASWRRAAELLVEIGAIEKNERSDKQDLKAQHNHEGLWRSNSRWPSDGTPAGRPTIGSNVIGCPARRPAS